MKNKFIFLGLILICIFFTSCDFVSYQVPAEEVDLKSEKIALIEKLEVEFKDKEYYDQEQKLFQHYLVQAKREMNESFDEDAILTVYEFYFSKIDALKDIPTYLQEERTRYQEKLASDYKLEAYRKEEQELHIEYMDGFTKAVNDEEKLENIKKIYEEYDVKFKALVTDEQWVASEPIREKYIDLLKSISHEDNYREKEKEIYLFYIQAGTEQLKQYANEKAFQFILEEYRKTIGEVKTNAEYEVEELEHLNNYKKEKIDEISNYILLEAYRLEEQKKIKEQLEVHIEQILESDDDAAIDLLVRDYKTFVYSCKTDVELYEEELASLKEETLNQITLSVVLNDYRDNEKAILNQLIENYTNMIQASKEKENVATLLESFLSISSSIKTDRMLYKEELVFLVNGYYTDLLSLVDRSSLSDENYQSYVLACDKVKEEMLNVEKKEEATTLYLNEKEKFYVLGAQLGDIKALEELKRVYNRVLEDSLNMQLYRVEQQLEITNSISTYTKKINSSNDYDTLLLNYNEGLDKLNSILTNDELWDKEDLEFFSFMETKYGAQLLSYPKSMAEATDYQSLADIIDWYAFYQLNGSSFERNKFRVKLKYEHRDAIWERNEVFWYCQLLRTAVSLDAVMESDDYIVFELIPYDFASVSNEKPSFVRKNTTLSIPVASEEKRDTSFDDFEYLKYPKKLRVWNSQQLWYALQLEYIPICDEGSIALACLSRAKEILREIINDTMSIEQKVLAVWQWFAKNVYYDNEMYRFNDSSDMENCPDERTSQLRSFFVEGVLFDEVAVCSGYSKAYTLFLRLEGIKTFHILARCNAMRGKNTINARDSGTGGYGSHEFNYVQMSDGKWYYSDVEHSFNQSGRSELQSYLEMMIPSDGQQYGYTVQFLELDFANRISHAFYDQLQYNEIKAYVSHQDYISQTLEGISKILNENDQVTLYFNKYMWTNFLETLLNYPDLEYFLSQNILKEMVFCELTLYKS